MSGEEEVKAAPRVKGEEEKIIVDSEVDSSLSSEEAVIGEKSSKVFLTCNTENLTHLPFETTQEIKVNASNDFVAAFQKVLESLR